MFVYFHSTIFGAGGGGGGKLYFLGGKQCVKSIDFKGYFFFAIFFLIRGFLLEVCGTTQSEIGMYQF